MDTIDILLTQLFAYIGEVIEWIGNTVGAMLKAVETWVKGIVTQITTFIQGLGAQLKTFFESVVNQITLAVTALIDWVKVGFQALLDAIWQVIQPMLINLQSWFDSAIQNVVSVVESAVESLYSWFTTAIANLHNFVLDLIGPFVTFIQDSWTGVQELIGEGYAYVKKAYDDLIKIITDAFNEFVGGADSLVEQIGAKLGDVKEGLKEAGKEIGSSFAEGVSGGLEDIQNLVKDLIKPYTSLMDEPSIQKVETALMLAFSPNTLDLTNRAEAHALVETLKPTSIVGRVIWTTLLSLFVAKDVYGGIVSANAQVILQEFAQVYPYQLLNPADSILAVKRGKLPRNEAIQNIMKQGYSEADAERLASNFDSTPTVNEALAMKKAGIITNKEWQEVTVQAGLSEYWEKAYESLGQIIPPVQDLITMAVKGAFSEQESALFKTDEDFPQEIISWCEKQGLDDKWMRKYWRSHWTLPSPTQGFEMFQRGIITEHELNVLLKALDITPFWRDNLVKLSYNTLGRVDIRRIHQLGMMNHEELVKAHRDLGYSPEDSERLAIFTEELNRGKPGEADEELGRLSRTNVINFYQDGVIPRPRAIELLVKIGYTEDAATLFIDSADFEAERQTRAADIEFILASAIAGVLDFGEAQDQLSQLKLSPIELDRATAKLLREQQKTTKLPTVEQGMKMYTSKIIGKPQFGDLLRRLGYRAQWAQAFIELADAPTTKN